MPLGMGWLVRWPAVASRLATLLLPAGGGLLMPRVCIVVWLSGSGEEPREDKQCACHLWFGDGRGRPPDAGVAKVTGRAASAGS